MVDLEDPSAQEFARISAALDLHPLAVDGSVSGRQRPTIEEYGDAHLVVLRPLTYLEQSSVVEPSELMVFLSREHVVTVALGRRVLPASLRSGLESGGDLARGPWWVLHAIIDLVVDEYLTIADELQTDLDDIEEGVFSTDREVSTQEIYALKREVLALKRVSAPLNRPLGGLLDEGGPVPDDELRLLFRDVHNHLSRVIDHTEAQDRLLSDVLSAHLAQVSVRQNQDMRKISAWAAMAAVPTLIAGVYGMNFRGMPELTASVELQDRQMYYGYPLAMLIMLAVCLVLYRLFKRSGWL